MSRLAAAAVLLSGCAGTEPLCAEPARELPSVALEECDGTTRNLDELNEPRAAWLFLYAGSWGSCQERAGSATALHDRYIGYSFRSFFVITEDDLYQAPTRQYCADKRSQFGLDMPVLINPAGDLPDAIGMPPNDVDIVTRCGAITLQGDYQRESDVRDAIDAALGY